jgi:hypothetical protein
MSSRVMKVSARFAVAVCRLAAVVDRGLWEAYDNCGGSVNGGRTN